MLALAPPTAGPSRPFIDGPKATATSKADAALLKTALARFKHAAEAETKQREREKADLAFEAGDQWPDDVKRSRRGQTVGNLVIPDRPCLVIDKIGGPIAQTVNQMRTSRFAIEIHPVSAGANAKTAEVQQGLIRHIEVASRAQNVRIAAGERAAKCGRGFYRILKTYANDGDFDLDLVISRIDNQFAVYFDPFAIEPTKSDAEWAFIVQDMPAERFRREFPRASLSHAEGAELSSIGDSAPGWIKGDGAPEGGAFRIAEYFRVERETKTLVMTASGWQGLSDAEDYPFGDVILMERPVETRIVHWVKMNAVEILEREVWDGRYIPIIPVVGKEYQIDGEKIYKGIVSNAKDAQRSYNYMRSKQVEAVGLAPIAPYVMAEGQDEGYEAMWATANTMPYSSLKYKPVALGDKPAPPPQRNVVEPAIQAITLAAHEADNDIKATTNVFDPSLGQNRGDQSGKAIGLLQAQSEHGNSNYLDNFAQAIAYEGEILLDLLPKVYDRPGRIARILGTDDKPSAVVLNQPFVPGQKGQDPQAIPAPPEGMPAPPLPPEAEHYDLTVGKYAATVNVGKSFSTRMEEQSAAIGAILEAAPQLAPVISDIWVESLNIPGGHAMAERIKKTLPPGIAETEDGEADPAAAQAQLAQASEQLQALQAEMQKLQQEALAKTQEVQGKAQIAQMEIQAKQAIAQMELASKERVEEMKAQAAMAATQAKVQVDQQKAELAAVLAQIKQQLDLRHEATQAALDRSHESVQLNTAHAHDAGKLAATQAHATTLQHGTQAHQGAIHVSTQAHADQQARAARQHEATLHTTPPAPAPTPKGKP